MYVLITPNKIKMLINEAENKAIQKAIINNDKAVFVQGATISLNITPEIYPFQNWYAQENERLALTHHRLCKKCLCIMSIEDKCACWVEQGKGENKNAFKQELPEGVKELIGQTVKAKEFPKLKDMDVAEIEFLSSRKSMAVNIGDVDGWVDEEGVTHYE